MRTDGRTAALVLLLVPVALVLLAVAGCSGSGAVTSFAQPENGAQVAAQAGATGYHDDGPAPGGGVADSGTAAYHGRKIGIDTFTTASTRDAWLREAEQLGVSPLMEGDFWVVYDSVTG